MNEICIEQYENMHIRTGVVWLTSPAAMGFKCHLALIATCVLHAYMEIQAPDKYTAWRIHSAKRKTYTEGE